MRLVWRIMLLLALLLSGMALPAAPAKAAPAQQSTLNPFFLQAQGKDLYWQGKKIVLKGTNFDNIGALGANIGTNNVNDVGYGQADYNTVASYGANHVRLGLSFSWWKNQRTTFWTKMDQQVAYARNAGIFLLFNMFTTPGNCYEGYGNSCSSFWGSNPAVENAEQAELRQFWVEMATRYKNEPAVAGYDLLNEPTPQGSVGYCTGWFTIAKRLIAAIRAVNTNQLIFLESCDDPENSFTYNNPPIGAAYPNIVYQAHYYGPMHYSHSKRTDSRVYPGLVSEWWGYNCYANKETMLGASHPSHSRSDCTALMNAPQRWAVNWANQNNVPIYWGEWGVSSVYATSNDYAEDVAEIIRDLGINHAHYTWKHRTVVSHPTYCCDVWGVVSQFGGAIDDTAKLATWRISLQGSVRPNFGSGGVTPQPTGLPTLTPTHTPTNTPTVTPGGATLTPTRTATSTPAPTQVGQFPETATPTNTAVPTSTPPAPPADALFYRAINVNGPTLTIGGNTWQASGTASNFTLNGTSNMSNQWMSLSPVAEATQARMIRTWRQYFSFAAAFTGVPNGQYQVYLYHVQDYDAPSANPVTVTIEGNNVATYNPPTGAGAGGKWGRLGPYLVTMSDGTMNIALNDLFNLAGIEIYNVAAPTPTPSNTPTNTPTSTPTPSNTPLPTVLPANIATFTLNVTQGSGVKRVTVVTTRAGTLTIAYDSIVGGDTVLVDNDVGGCYAQPSSWVCFGYTAGTIRIDVPDDTVRVSVLQTGNNGARIWPTQ